MREPVVFIGKILSVDNGEVSVFVEHPFKGVMAGGYVTELPPTTSCRVFTPQVGERWFFSGMFEPSPTMLLQKAETEGEPQQVEGQPTPTANLVRLDDIKLNMLQNIRNARPASSACPSPMTVPRHLSTVLDTMMPSKPFCRGASAPKCADATPKPP